MLGSPRLLTKRSRWLQQGGKRAEKCYINFVTSTLRMPFSNCASLRNVSDISGRRPSVRWGWQLVMLLRRDLRQWWRPETQFRKNMSTIYPVRSIWKVLRCLDLCTVVFPLSPMQDTRPLLPAWSQTTPKPLPTLMVRRPPSGTSSPTTPLPLPLPAGIHHLLGFGSMPAHRVEANGQYQSNQSRVFRQKKAGEKKTSRQMCEKGVSYRVMCAV